MENKQEEFKLEITENSKVIPSDYLEIEKYYKEAKELVSSGSKIKAQSLIWNMPIHLYDKSINILFNKNHENFSYPPLKQLIHEVDIMFYGNILDEDPDLRELTEEEYANIEKQEKEEGF